MAHASRVDVALEAALERLTEAGLDKWLDQLRERAGEEVFLKLADLFKREPTKMRGITGALSAAGELVTSIIPMPEKVRNLGEEILKHLPVAVERWAVRSLPATFPLDFQPASVSDVPVLGWKFLKGAFSTDAAPGFVKFVITIQNYLRDHQILQQFKHKMEGGFASLSAIVAHETLQYYEEHPDERPEERRRRALERRNRPRWHKRAYQWVARRVHRPY